jgi:Rod binding domain-containing protein
MDLDSLQKAGLPVLAPSTETRLAVAREAASKDDPDQTARQFEALFATLLVREMRRAIPGGLFGKGAGADVFEGWFDDHVGQSLASREALGIGAMVRTSILREQAALAGESTAGEPPTGEKGSS